MQREFFARSRFWVSTIAILNSTSLEFFEHENIVKLIDIQKPIDQTEYKDVYIVTEKMEADLGRLIHSKQPLSDKHYSYFMY
jgi:mitogen-activated protein kinase 1/3